MRYRRPRSLVCYWLEGTFVAHAFAHGTPAGLHPAAAEILTAFDDWTEAVDAAKSLEHLDPDALGESIQVLAECGLLVAEGSPEAARDAAIDQQWGPWAPEASFYHYATQLRSMDELDKATAQELVADGRPALFTNYPDADRLFLPRRPADLSASFGQVLYGRRSHRDFSPAPVPHATLAALLATTFGPVDFVDADAFGALIRRTSAAGGARQELEAYVGALNVDGVDAGWYHYNAREHSLELLSGGFSSQEAVALCTDQEWVGRAGFLVVLSAVVERMAVKYRVPRSYRVCLLNAGHLGQTFALTATALGLGPAQTGAFCDLPLAERLGLDNVTQTPLYVLAAGLPLTEGEPQDTPQLAGLNASRITTY